MNIEEQDEALNKQRESLEAMSQNLQMMLQQSIAEQKTRSDDFIKAEHFQSALEYCTNPQVISKASNPPTVAAAPTFSPAPTFAPMPASPKAPTLAPPSARPTQAAPTKPAHQRPPAATPPPSPAPQKAVYKPFVPTHKGSNSEQGAEKKAGNAWENAFESYKPDKTDFEALKKETKETKDEGIPGWVIITILIVAFIAIRSCGN